MQNNEIQHVFLVGATVIIGTTKRGEFTRTELESRPKFGI